MSIQTQSTNNDTNSKSSAAPVATVVGAAEARAKQGSGQAKADDSRPSPPRMDGQNPVINGKPNGQLNGSTPQPIASHSRKGSIMVGGGVDIQKGNIAFGTANIDSPNPLLSSSPAAPSTTGAHLAGTVKAFGSIDADGPTDNARRQSALGQSAGPGENVTSPPHKQPDLHTLFGAKPKAAAPTAQVAKSVSPIPPPAAQSSANMAASIHGRRPSMNGNYPMQNGMVGGPGNPVYSSPNNIAGQPHLRPPQMNANVQPRSPNGNPMIPGHYNGAIPQQNQQGFRPAPAMQANASQNGIRPNAHQAMQGQMHRPNMMMPQQHVGGYGMHHPQQSSYPMMPYPSQGYYDGYNVYSPQQFSINPQWAPQQHPQNQQFNGSLSPLAPPSQLGNASQPSPSPHPAALPNSGGASPVPTPPSRPGSLINHQSTQSNVSLSSLPSTPSRSNLPPSGASTPQNAQAQLAGPPYGGLSGGASSFTPRASKVIRFSRPDGTAVDIKEAAAAVKVPTPSTSTPVKSPEVKAEEQPAEPPKKKLPTLPVMVRLESEEQKKARLAEEEQQARIRKEEEREAQERKERKERLAREEEEAKAKAVAAAAAKEKEAAEEAKKAATPSIPEPTKSEAQTAPQNEGDKLREALKAEQTAAKKQEQDQQAAAAPTRSDEAATVHASKEAAREAADEKARALLTPTVTSTPTSPLASPALASAGLPAKPPVATGAPRRAAPAALDIKASSSPAESGSSPSTSKISAAQPIEDIASIVYPGEVKSPRPDLNVDSKPGKFRYDRDFLMQFMNVCREKPENLPPLAEIGLDSDSSSGFGSSRGGRGSRNSIGSGRGGSATGLGIGLGGGRPGAFPAQGMGSFNMGSFGSGSIRGTTSEERYNRSLAQGRQGSMARTPSQGGPGGLHGLPPMSMSTSRSGGSRSQRGQKRLPQDSRNDPNVAPLVSSTNSWVKSRPTGDDEGSPAYIERKVKALLNKLTAEKFDSISMQILEWANKSANETDGMTLKLVIKQIFEKATDEAHWSNMYARLCRLLLERLDPAITETIDDKPLSGGMLFRRYLIGRCQLDFEAGWKAREDAATAAAAKSEEDKERLAQHEAQQQGGSGSGEAAMLSDEYYAAQKAKRRGLGLVQLIGELFNLDMIGKGVIRTCFIKLLGNIETPDEEDIESCCKLLTTVGKPFEAASAESMGVVFERLAVVQKLEHVPSRIKFMIMDVNDLRKARWESKNKTGGVMTIAEVHQAAAREQAEKAAAAAQSARESISRGGSRAGHPRAGPGEWQAVPNAARPVPRTDFTNIGRNMSSSGMPSFAGPTSVFAKRGGKAAGTTTPPLSRQASTTNMFSALRDEHNEGAGDAQGGATGDDNQPQRRKLKLQPRTAPIGGGEEAESPKDENSADANGASASMTEDGAKQRIDTDMKELWGEKGAGGSRDPADIVEYFKAMPQEHQHLLAIRLVDDIFVKAKLKDAEVVAKGWSQALEQNVVKAEVLKKGLEPRLPGLDEESIDFPSAYASVANLMKSLNLSEDEVKELGGKIEVDGTPRITPQQKLEKALAALAE